MTIDVVDSSPSRRSSLRRSSSYSMDSAKLVSKDPLDRIRDYSARSTESRYPSDSPLAPPAYSPPPNTPANTYAPVNYTKGVEIHGITQRGPEHPDNDPFNPFSYAGPTQYPNHALQKTSTQSSNGLWQGNGNYEAQYPNLPSPSAFQTPNAGITDLERTRRGAVSDYPQKKKRCCKRTTLVCCAVTVILLAFAVAAAIVIVMRLRHHFHDQHHHTRMNCLTDPGMYVNGHWVKGYERCT